jgi:hypothetical protein
MASLNLPNCHSSYAIVRANGEGIQILFPLDSNEFAVVTTIRLSLWFQLNVTSLHIDEEIFDSVTRVLTYTIGQLPVCNGDGKHWLLTPERYRLYGLIESIIKCLHRFSYPSLFV